MSSKDLIITLPHPHLYQKSRKVGLITDELRRVIDNMKAATLDWEASRPHEVGVALAAIQIDQPYKVIIIRNNFDNKRDRSFSVFINPQIVKTEGEISEDYEGCLSVKDIYGKVPRRSKVRLRAMDEHGRIVRVKAEGFLARVIQHEIDHLSGQVFVDHIKVKTGAFYKLAPDGKLSPIDYEQIQKSHIFRT
ncbi:peptide deformylase [Candidatus Saccharibacteria bacterium]|nr:peptide deformylase [Candidatus Saccharibacteria bacterium]